jgi:dipeptidase D
MSNDIKNLKPAAIWKYFHDITQIPRPSKSEARIVEYVGNFGKERGLFTFVDGTGNVIIRKPATPGMENRKGVVLQSHLDMVPQKNRDSNHDFENDPVKTFIKGEWVTAGGTTLGADNGLGVAAALAILDSDNIAHGPLEALFTVDEETGMTGAFRLQGGLLEGGIMLNLDSEDEGELYVGCAGGLDANISFSFTPVAVPANSIAVEIRAGGLKGGHSGLDIGIGRGNANKLLFRFLKHAVQKFDVMLASVDGGSLRNAIPRDASAIVVVDAAMQQELANEAEKYEKIYRGELSEVEPDLYFTIKKSGLPSTLIDNSTRDRLINGIVACPNGVIRMSCSMPGLVETSINLARVVSGNDGGKNLIKVQCLLRSSVDTARDELAGMAGSVFTLAGANVSFDGAYPGWKPDMNSEILTIMKDVYNSLFGKVPGIKAIHAGLECGIIGGIYPGMDMISFGPTIRYPHSPDEKVHIGSVEKFWIFLVETLKNIPPVKK